MKCELCGRDGLSEKELRVHKLVFHKDVKERAVSHGACPECGSSLIMQEGCMHCGACGYSKC